MTNNGTGMYYKSGLPLDHNSQIIADFGFHFNSLAKTINNEGTKYNNRTIYMELFGGYRKEYLKTSIAGIFHPILSFQGGSSMKINQLLWKKNRDSIFIYVFGIGFQFYNGRILNEMLLKFNKKLVEGNFISFQLSIYWK